MKSENGRDVIRRNSAKCLECNTEIVSKHRHDFVSCTCGNIYIDGGNDYFRRGVKDFSKFLDTSIYEEE